jgi:cobalt-zinc-cadmium efflux system protein
MASHAGQIRPAVLSRLAVAMGAVAALLALEVVTALLSHSLALLGDAGHLLTDAASLALASYAVWRSRLPASARHTFGHHRTGILVAAFNGIVLLAVAVSLAVAAIARLGHPAEVSALPVILVAVVALAVNGGLAVLLADAGGELSVRSALLHVLADGIAAVGVLVSAVIILTAGWLAADSVAALLIAVLITAGAVRLLRETFEILGERTPRGLDAGQISAVIAGIRGVEGVHDLHIWSLSRRHRALSAHVTVGDRPMAEVTAVLRDVETTLCAQFAIEHVTLQPECPSCVVEPALYCDLEERHSLHEVEAGRS